MKFTFYNDAFIIGHKRRLYYEHDFSKGRKAEQIFERFSKTLMHANV